MKVEYIISLWTLFCIFSIMEGQLKILTKQQNTVVTTIEMDAVFLYNDIEVQTGSMCV